MRPLLSPALAQNGVARQRVYTTLLAEPGRDWTLAAIAQCLPDVAVIEVQATLNMLLGDRLLDAETVMRQRPLRVRLTGEGEQMLTAILRSWETAGQEQNAPAAQERGAQ
ncbi:MAG TPA: hypothetical protein DGT23_10655 [Micromonosporaceae bacterium]|nr:hypothetical protein [Micromonosporaceae bacterium]